MCVRSSRGKCVDSDNALKFSERESLPCRGWCSWHFLDFCGGSLLIANFMVVWAVPIAIQGLIWKHTVVSKVARYLHDVLVVSSRTWAERYLYTNARSADYCATSLLLVANFIISISAMIYCQLSGPDHMPPLVVVLYLLLWVGPGGRAMGGVYALAHREGHLTNLYKQEVRFNYFENAIGCFYGIVPMSFGTGHVSIHHGLNAGEGDTFYLWDLDRSSLRDFPIYVARIFRHMVCWSPLRYYWENGHNKLFSKLSRGVLAYACVITAVLGLSQSPIFVFLVMIQPLFCMTVFLAVLNVGFHGFYEVDAARKAIKSVVSSTIIEGDDDYWGEDDHMAHHSYPVAHHDDIPRLHAARVGEFRRTKASVFRGLSSLELGLFILLGLWDTLADHYVDYSGKLDKQEIARLLQTRAQRREISPHQYAALLGADPTQGIES